MVGLLKVSICAFRLRRLRCYAWAITQTLLPLVLTLFVSGCTGMEKQESATRSVEESSAVQVITATPVVSTPSPAPATPTHTPVPSPTATKTPTWPQIAGLLSENLPASLHAYILPLTVRHVMQEQATLFFESDEPVDGFLFYQEISPQQQEVKAIPLAPGEARQQITLEDLTPGAEYLAIVGINEMDGVFRQPVFLDEAWNSVRFRTAAGQQPLRVGVFGDASFGDSATEALVKLMASYNLDFAIHTGDVVAEIYENSGPVEAYALKFYKTISPLLHQMPVYTVIGNHDYDSAARWQDSYFYYYAFPPFPDFSFPPPKNDIQYYAFAYNDVQFLMLDSQVIFGVAGRDEQKAWMVERLSDPRFRFTIPVFHVPPFFSGSVHSDDQLPVRQSWHQIFVAAQVPLALSGHSHHYERLLADGITYIVSGGGSGILYAPGEILPQSQVFARRTHFVLLEIYYDHIALSAIDKEGKLLDSAEIAPSTP